MSETSGSVEPVAPGALGDTTAAGAKLPFLNNGIAQIAWLVPDLEATVTAYHERFGVGPWHFYTYGPPLVKKASYRGKPSSYRMRVALSYFGPMRVEFIQPLDGPSIYHEHIDAHGYGVHHLGVLVDDMTSALQQAAAAGYGMIQDGSGFGPDGDGHYAYIDTEREFGVVYELIQRPARRHPPEKIFPGEG